MNYQWLIIDGYNLLHQIPELAKMFSSDKQGARHRLVRLVEETAHAMARQTTIVFDGRETGKDSALTSRYLEVCFSPSHLSADTVIERLVCQFQNPEKILVVTSDRAERDTVSGAGALTMSSQEFIEKCRPDSKRAVVGKRTPPGKEPKLGDLFPEEW